MKRTRAIAIFVAAFYFLALIFSVNLLVAQSNHEHFSEDDCAICAELENCNDLLHASATKVGASEHRAHTRGPVAEIDPRATSARRNRRTTPVSLKDKLIS